MPKPSERTRSAKRITKTLPGRGRAIHYKHLSAGPNICGRCGRIIAGFPRSSSTRANVFSKSQKKVFRPYGGQLCFSCLRDLIKDAARHVQA